MTAAALILAAASAGIYLPSKVDKIRKHRRAVRQYQIDEERELGEAMYAANVSAFERLGRSANR